LLGLLGLSPYQKPPTGPDLDSPEVEAMRRANGGQIAMQPYSQTRWYLADLETAEHAADTGYMHLAARLMLSARKDGVLAGVLSTRTGGLVRLPKRFIGDSAIISELDTGHGSVRSVFDEMFPPSELALLAADGELLGVGVGELREVVGRDYPLFVRLDPAGLIFRWNENQWYYNSVAGPIPVNPGDGRWVLHTPGGRNAPWQNGLWKAVGRAYIRKEHANLHKDNWEAKLANPARVAFAPQGSTEGQKEDWFRRVMAWGVNTVFGLTPGYDVKLLESNGRGYDSFVKTIADCNNEFIICVAGQTVTTDGGTGFANADVHKSIRADLIKATAEALAYTLNTQGIPPFVLARYGEDALDRSPQVSWDVDPPKDRQAEANTLIAVAQAITQMQLALEGTGQELDVAAVCSKFGVPVTQGGEVRHLSLVKKAS
jgi:hypothetical protein